MRRGSWSGRDTAVIVGRPSGGQGLLGGGGCRCRNPEGALGEEGYRIRDRAVRSKEVGLSVKVRLRNPDRVEVIEGPKTVRELLAALGVHPDSVIVIRRDELLTRDDKLSSDDEIELRPVVSGG